jgi:hypothetical protein
MDYSKLPKTIISPISGDTLELKFLECERDKEEDSYEFSVGDYSHEYREFCYNDTVQAIYHNDKTEERILIV